MLDTRLTTPPSTPIPDTILGRTPHSAKEIVDRGMVLQRRILAGKKVDPKYLSRFIKGSMASAHSRQIMEDELKSVQRQATAKAKRKSSLGQLRRRVGLLLWEM